MVGAEVKLVVEPDIEKLEVVVGLLDVHYPEEKLLIQLFLIESNLSIYTL